MGTFNFYNFNKEFYIFEDNEDFNNFYYSNDFQKSKILKEAQVFDNVGFVELVASSGYSYGGSLDYISLLDYFDYNSEKQDKKEYFHEFFNDVIETENLKNIHKYTKEDIIYKFIDFIIEYEDIDLSHINLKNYKLNNIRWNRTKKDLKDFIIKVFDEMIKQDIKKAKERLKHIAENFGAVYVERTGAYTVEKIK